MKKLKTKTETKMELPDLTGLEFKFIRKEMGITQEMFARQLKGKSYKVTGRIEMLKRRRVKVYEVQCLHNIDPAMFFKAYSLLQKEPINKNIDDEKPHSN
jgi:hypothetical protein